MSNKTLHLHKLIHDIKSPITSVLGYSEFLKKHLNKKETEKEYEWADSLNTESKKIRQLILEITEEVQKLD